MSLYAYPGVIPRNDTHQDALLCFPTETLEASEQIHVTVSRRKEGAAMEVAGDDSDKH